MTSLDPQETFQKRFFEYLKGGRLHSGLLITGPNSELKYKLAKSIAKVLLCSKSSAPFCTDCNTCRRIEAEIHPDLLISEPEESGSIKVESIREISHYMILTSVESENRVCVLVDCHQMSIGAANAFLKTLEEPARGRYFILLTPLPASLPPTVRSRCVEFRLTPTQVEDLSADTELFEQTLSTYLKSRDLSLLTPVLGDKDRCHSFIRFVQAHLRNRVQRLLESKFDDLPALLEILSSFDRVVQVEERLRSNANHVLMLENLMVGYSV